MPTFNDKNTGWGPIVAVRPNHLALGSRRHQGAGRALQLIMMLCVLLSWGVQQGHKLSQLIDHMTPPNSISNEKEYIQGKGEKSQVEDSTEESNKSRTQETCAAQNGPEKSDDW